MKPKSVGSVCPAHSDSSLVLEVELAQPARGRHLSPTEIRWADPLPTDRYATGRGSCVDMTGRRRAKHEYTIWTRAGLRCWACGRLRTWEPL